MDLNTESFSFGYLVSTFTYFIVFTFTSQKRTRYLAQILLPSQERVVILIKNSFLKNILEKYRTITIIFKFKVDFSATTYKLK